MLRILKMKRIVLTAKVTMLIFVSYETPDYLQENTVPNITMTSIKEGRKERVAPPSTPEGIRSVGDAFCLGKGDRMKTTSYS